MGNIHEFLTKYAERGACKCGLCFDAPKNSEEHQPSGHTVNLTFFEVSLKDNEGAHLIRDEFAGMVKEQFPQWLDGKEHSYMEIGGDLGDQGYALICIGIGHLLGLWSALSPDIMMPTIPKELKTKMAGSGFVMLKVMAIKGDGADG